MFCFLLYLYKLNKEVWSSSVFGQIFLRPATEEFLCLIGYVVWRSACLQPSRFLGLLLVMKGHCAFTVFNNALFDLKNLYF